MMFLTKSNLVSVFSLACLLSLFGSASAQAAMQQTQANIDNTVRAFQSSRPSILSSEATVFDCANCAGTYQNQARLRTMDRLNGQVVAGFNIRQYYVLACIYFATNGVGNPRTNNIIPGEEIPEWKNEEGWFTNVDYCTWFGVACFNTLSSTTEQVAQEANKRVVEINLSNNDLYGQFPNEIALLSQDLIAIDLFGNFFHWCGDYRWMNALGNLEALFFGSTSWDAVGVPLVLRFLDNLEEIDLSNTFWRGVLTENAFNNLKKLRYLDIGQNFFDFDGDNEIPDYISGLPLLTNLYIDNIRPDTGSSLASLDLSFISRMANIIELWADYTNVVGPIPDDIGDATTLQSLSLVYCKLTGTIPNSIVNTQMDRMWLYGNPNLNGGFPDNFASLQWTFLYLEGTGITMNIPKGICDQVGNDETMDLIELGADCDICPTGCCTCCGDACNNLRSPTPAPTGGDVVAGPVFCFSGDSTVEVENQGFVKMSKLSLGDSINVGDNKFEPIYSFGHKNAKASGDFISIHAEGGRKLELSEDHMVTLEGGRIVPAAMVQIGDHLVTASGNTAAVETIRTVKRTGLYAPFTASGKVVVNDVVASNYVAFQGQQYYTIAGIETPFNYHWMAHIFNSVHRIAYKMGFANTETYTEDGTSTWVSAPRDLGLWLLDQNPVVMVLGLAAYIALFGTVTLMESYPLTLIAAALTVLVARRSAAGVSLKMKKM